MKKLICFCMIYIMLFSLAACGTDNTNNNTDKTDFNEKVSQQSVINSDVSAEQEYSSTASITAESSASTTSIAETKPLNERIVCFECCYKYGLVRYTEEVETAVLYQQYDELKCCKCGGVDMKDYKSGDYIYVLTE